MRLPLPADSYQTSEEVLQVFLTAQAEGYDIPGFQIPEGLSRITRNGHTDIYLIQNQMPLGSYWVRLAYELDDFEEGKSRGHNLHVRESHAVERLGGIKESCRT